MRTRNIVIAFICAVLCMALTACPVRRGGQGGGVYAPCAVYDKNYNQYLILYQREPIGGDNYGYRGRGDMQLYGQMINADRTPAVAEFSVTNGFSSMEAGSFAAEYDDLNRRFLVVWSASGSLNGQIVNADGSLEGAGFVIAAVDSRPALAYDSVNMRFLVAWADRSDNAAGVYARLVNADGTLMGPPALITDSLHLYYYEDGPSSLAYDADTQRFLVVLKDSRNIYALVLNADGSRIGNAVVLSYSPVVREQPIALYDGVNRRYLVSWREGSYLLGQLINADGTQLGSRFVMSGAISLSSRHALAFDAAGQQYLEVFDDTARYDWRVYGQIVTINGIPPNVVSNSPFLISLQGFQGARYPSVAFGAANRTFFVLWEYSGPGSRYSDIHGQMVHPDGTPDGPLFIVATGGQ